MSRDRLCGHLHDNWLMRHLPARVRFGFGYEVTKRIEKGTLALARRLPDRLRYAAFIVEVADATSGPLAGPGAKPIPDIPLADLLRTVGER